jgi:hypothetical protein
MSDMKPASTSSSTSLPAMMGPDSSTCTGEITLLEAFEKVISCKFRSLESRLESMEKKNDLMCKEHEKLLPLLVKIQRDVGDVEGQCRKTKERIYKVQDSLDSVYEKVLDTREDCEDVMKSTDHMEQCLSRLTKDKDSAYDPSDPIQHINSHSASSIEDLIQDKVVNNLDAVRKIVNDIDITLCAKNLHNDEAERSSSLFKRVLKKKRSRSSSSTSSGSSSSSSSSGATEERKITRLHRDVRNLSNDIKELKSMKKTDSTIPDFSTNLNAIKGALEHLDTRQKGTNEKLEHLEKLIQSYEGMDQSLNQLEASNLDVINKFEIAMNKSAVLIPQQINDAQGRGIQDIFQVLNAINALKQQLQTKDDDKIKKILTHLDSKEVDKTRKILAHLETKEDDKIKKILTHLDKQLQIKDDDKNQKILAHLDTKDDDITKKILTHLEGQNKQLLTICKTSGEKQTQEIKNEFKNHIKDLIKLDAGKDDSKQLLTICKTSGEKQTQEIKNHIKDLIKLDAGKDDSRAAKINELSKSFQDNIKQVVQSIEDLSKKKPDDAQIEVILKSVIGPSEKKLQEHVTKELKKMTDSTKAKSEEHKKATETMFKQLNDDQIEVILKSVIGPSEKKLQEHVTKELKKITDSKKAREEEHKKATEAMFKQLKDELLKSVSISSEILNSIEDLKQLTSSIPNACHDLGPKMDKLASGIDDIPDKIITNFTSLEDNVNQNADKTVKQSQKEVIAELCKKFELLDQRLAVIRKYVKHGGGPVAVLADQNQAGQDQEQVPAAAAKGHHNNELKAHMTNQCKILGDSIASTLDQFVSLADTTRVKKSVDEMNSKMIPMLTQIKALCKDMTEEQAKAVVVEDQLQALANTILEPVEELKPLQDQLLATIEEEIRALSASTNKRPLISNNDNDNNSVAILNKLLSNQANIIKEVTKEKNSEVVGSLVDYLKKVQLAQSDILQKTDTSIAFQTSLNGALKEIVPTLEAIQNDKHSNTVLASLSNDLRCKIGNVADLESKLMASITSVNSSEDLMQLIQQVRSFVDQQMLNKDKYLSTSQDEDPPAQRRRSSKFRGSKRAKTPASSVSSTASRRISKAKKAKYTEDTEDSD